MAEFLQAMTALVASLGALMARRAAREAAQINDAVNHRHRTGTPRLYDLTLKNSEQVRELIEWKRSYEGGPLDDGDKVRDFCQRTEASLDDTHQRLGRIELVIRGDYSPESPDSPELPEDD